MFNSDVARVPCARGTRTILASPLTKLQNLKWKIYRIRRSAEAQKSRRSKSRKFTV